MAKLYLAIVLTAEVAVIALLSFGASGFPVLLLVPILPLTLVAALLLRHLTGSPAYQARRLSPEDIVRYQTRKNQASTPEALSRRIVERADEIHHTLIEPSSEIQIEMCALGYRACVNDMITLTHFINEEMKTAGPLKRLSLRAARRRATDSLSRAREAIPSGALRATRQEHQ